MSGRYRGFTLLEVVIALSIIAIAFTTLLEVLTYLGRETQEAEVRFLRYITLDRKIKERDHEGVEVEWRDVPEYPLVREKVYRLGEVVFFRYERR
jgi:prepilin-type N-terminal cleavage/methylation domain-containing protein